jgi:NTE family protein
VNAHRPKTRGQTMLSATLLATLACLALDGTDPARADTVAEEEQAPRPRIGLVLGGGGARGSAHVGVLKVLEELRIPIDYIAGNSMGAIVGGLYASGLTPDEIGHELKTIDWDDTFNDDPPRPDRAFRRKRDDDLYVVKPKLGYSDGEVKFPLALIQGQKFDLQLSRLTLHVANVHDFNKMPFPFRAVAADIETGKEVVLQSGNLARSIRASMAVPGAFDPVEIDGRLLVDGLVVNNVPLNVARDMGADILIVVDVGSGLLKRNEIKGVVDVVGQLTNILSDRNVELQLSTLKPSDILIRPNLGKLGSGDFNKAAEGIEMGEQAARELGATLGRLSVDPASYKRHMARRETRAGTPVIEFVRLDNQSRIGDQTILAKISARPGRPLDRAQLDADIGTVYGLDVFESVRYEVVREDGKTGLLLHTREKSWGPDYLQFGMALSDNFEGDSSYNLGVLYTKTAINPLNGEFRLGVQIGQDPALTAEWHQPLDVASRYFVSTKTYLRRDQFSRYDGDDIISDYNIWRVGLDLAIGREFGTWGEGRVGYRRFKGEADVRIGDPALDDYSFDGGQLYGRLFLDKLDNVYFPTQGNKGILELTTARKSLGSDSSYDQARLSYSHAFSRGRNNFVGAFRFDTTPDDDAPPEGLFRAGGFLSLSGYRPNQLSGQHYGQAVLVFYRRITDTKILPAYIGGSIEYGNVWQDRDDIAFDDGLLNGSLFLGADTPVGPAYFGLGLGEGGNNTVFFYLGPAF